MAAPSVTYSFSNSTTADATEVNQNFDDVINGITDGTKDLTISAFQANGAATFNGAVTLGNATSDDITITGRIASDFDPKTAATYTLGDSTQTWQGLYLDNGATDGGAVYFNAGTTAFLKSDASGADLDVGGFTGLDLKAAEIKRMSLYDEAKTADYTVTDTDGVSIIYMTTSTTNRTVTLPTAADNAGRVITCKKVDSASGLLTVDGEGSETIDGNTTYICPLQGDFVTVQCDGSAWHVIQKNDTSAWFNETPTLNYDSTAATNISSSASSYRRVGTSMECMFSFNFNGAANASGDLNIVIPASFTMATGNPIPNDYQPLGIGQLFAGGNQYSSVARLQNNDADQVYFVRVANAGASDDLWSDTVPATLASGHILIANFSVPISEWTP